jgi:hypothetical protein
VNEMLRCMVTFLGRSLLFPLDHMSYYFMLILSSLSEPMAWAACPAPGTRPILVTSKCWLADQVQSSIPLSGGGAGLMLEKSPANFS